MEPVVQLRGAVTLLGRFPALAGIDLEVAAGEVVLLRGPNGAGKTTLLRCCAGLVPLARGEARVLGPRPHRPPPGPGAAAPGRAARARHRASTTSSPSPTTCGSGAGRPAPGRRTSTPPSTPAGSAGAWPASPVARLSAGQRRRTALACLVARRPELWLLDEPHAGLDHEGRDLLDDLVHRAQAAGATDRRWPPTSSTAPRRSPTASSRSPAAPSRRPAPPAPPTEEPVLVP